MKPTNTERNIEAQTSTLAGASRSSLLAAAIAFVIYVVIAALTGDGFTRSVFLFGLGLAVFTFVVSFAINLIVRAVRGQRRR